MISGKAVEAAARAHDAEDAAQRGEPDPWSIEGDDFTEFRSDRIASMRAALSAALPVMLEGKREEIARLCAPDVFLNADLAMKWEKIDKPADRWWSAGMAMRLVDVQAAFDRADRIIAMLGGGE